ncbi:MAG: 2-(1,2-epoxy-1,2-dihydrophenyl)acetyl-CoA isomerase [Alteromonadaceae bacterium]|jgi:2-(1,2-epoxy-1,2-dihydrophenyl)acetyl-CoA isomerase
MFETIQVENNNGVALITLNRPDKLNSFNTQMHIEMQQALDNAVSDDAVKSILITGAGRGFCAGQDLSDRAVSVDSKDEAPTAPDLSSSIEKYYNPLIRRITNSPKPVVCAVNGVAAGAGASIAIACDVVIAARSASFVLAFANIGLVPDSGCTWNLTHAIGLARAKAFAMLGERVKAEQALEWGMIWQVADNENLMSEAIVLAERLAAQPPLAMQHTKQLMNTAFEHSLDSQVERERLAMQYLGKTEDYKEGVAAFMEKRKPVYQGK